MDFKIGDEIEDVSNNPKKKNSKLPIIIVVIISLVCGLSVFLISNAFFGKKEPKQPPVVDTQLSLNDDNVQILYAYVTYGTRNKRNDKFLKEQNVTINSFSNQEKFYYALQFAEPEDFTNTGKVDKDNHKIYNISSAKIKNYMQRFFGGQVSYSNNSVITYPFSFQINGQNVGTLTYSIDRDGFDTIFNGLEEDITEEKTVEPYYTELVSATKKADGTYELQEKVIYTETTIADNMYKIEIYKDYEHTMLLETRQNITEEQVKEDPVTIEKYKDRAATITYHFKLNGNVLYFDSSEISN